MAFGIIIIGDEILSGRRSDKHFAKIIELLGERGLSLGWAEYIGDDPVRITETLRRSLSSGDIVFSCGGIGATPDDHTRQCAADALGVPLQLHPDAKRLIQERIVEMAEDDPAKADLNSAENLHRLKMAEFPAGNCIKCPMQTVQMQQCKTTSQCRPHPLVPHSRGLNKLYQIKTASPKNGNY